MRVQRAFQTGKESKDMPDTCALLPPATCSKPVSIEHDRVVAPWRSTERIHSSRALGAPKIKQPSPLVGRALQRSRHLPSNQQPPFPPPWWTFLCGPLRAYVCTAGRRSQLAARGLPSIALRRGRRGGAKYTHPPITG